MANDNQVQRRSLSAADSLMWRIEADPVLRSPVVVVGLLDRAPRRKQLRATLERATRAVPGLRHRIVAPPVPLGRHRWEPDNRFSLDHHLRWVRALDGGVRGVLDLIEPDVTALFDPQRPMWSLTIVEGLHGKRAAMVLRFHHSITDGIGGLHLAASIFDTSRHPAEPDSSDESDDLGTSAAVDGVGGLALGDRLADGLDRLLGGAGAVATAARDPRGAAAESLRLVRSIGRLLSIPPPGSPLLPGRSLDRRLEVLELPFADLRAAATAAGGTINDVLLAAVAGAFRGYHEQHRVSMPTMTVTMPVNVRQAGEEEGGNRFAPTRFVLPVDEVDPRVRTRIVGAIARSWCREPALGLTKFLAAGLNLLPGPAVTRLFGSMLRSIDADVVDLPGLTEPVYFGGARLDRLWAFAPPTGAAFSVTLMSHLDTACVGIAYDRAAIELPEVFTNCLQSSFEEVLALGSPPGASPSGARADDAGMGAS